MKATDSSGAGDRGAVIPLRVDIRTLVIHGVEPWLPVRNFGNSQSSLLSWSLKTLIMWPMGFFTLPILLSLVRESVWKLGLAPFSMNNKFRLVGESAIYNAGNDSPHGTLALAHVHPWSKKHDTKTLAVGNIVLTPDCWSSLKFQLVNESSVRVH